MTGNAPFKKGGNTAAPPFLLLAALVFWGWQSGLLVFGVVMGVLLESSRLVKTRFDFSTVDFRRIWNFCGLLGFAVAFYAFTTGEEAAGIGNLLHGSEAGRNAMASSLRVATLVPRWMPIILFLLVAAQNFSENESLPLSAISFFARWRQRAATGTKPEWNVNISYPYFMVCLFSAGIHSNEGTNVYFWGVCAMLGWALWPLRGRRFGAFAWFGVLLLAVALAYGGTRGIAQLAQLAESYNARWMARVIRQHTDAAQTTTAIGQIGDLELSSAIVIRLETKPGASPPTYLHEASYYNYHSQAWYAGGPQNVFRYVSPEATNNSTYYLLPGPVGSNVVNIACYLDGWSRELQAPEGLLPLPSGCSGLEHLPTSIARIQVNLTGAVMAAGPGLAIIDARYGGTATIDSPPDTNWDWSVPANEAPALKAAIAEIGISGTNDQEKELAVAGFFLNKFTYSTWLGPDKTRPTNGTPLSRFLLETRSGHCEYFATATVLLLREMGIPARYAVGYFVHEESGADHYVVRGRDAHAWCLVWDKENQAWKDFDTTPGSWVAAESKRASMMQSVWDFFSRLHFELSKFRWGQSNLRNYILWAVAPIMAFLLYQIIFRRGRRRQRPKPGNQNEVLDAWPGLDSEFYRLESQLAASRVPRRAGEALVDWIDRILAENKLLDLRAPLEEILRLHYRYRFDPKGLEAGERKLLATKVDAVLRNLAQIRF